jgi:hypothetical protein
MANTLNRRQVIRSLMSGSILFPGIVAQLLADDNRGSTPADSLVPKAPHFTPRAKSVIFMFMTGGVSHMDTFDPKPKLAQDAGKPDTDAKRRLLAPSWEFRPGGHCGTMVSDLFPYIRQQMDDICLIRSMRGDHNDHFQATLGIHTGSVSFARPSLGSWVSYGLGTENQNLPSFVVLAPQLPYAGSQVFSADFLPGCHQGTRVVAGAEPIANLNRRSRSLAVQELELSLLAQFNRRHQAGREADPALAARIKSYETAFGMQMAMPDVLDLRDESDATLQLFGLERGSTKGFAWQCLVARRLVERGVRFIELVDVGSSRNWDAHSDMKTHEPLAKNVDQAMAGLIQDLKLRGMLDETLLVWTTEFGRTPFADSPKGRSHHAPAFSSWLAGGGVKGGIAYGKTDDYGGKVVENQVHVHDFHATILHLLGFDHERLTFRHGGRDFRLTDVHGRVVKDVLA